MRNNKYAVTCPKCGTLVHRYRNPLLTVDLIIHVNDQHILLIRRKNPPYGWALPGGFVDYGESLETAAEREAKEETGLVLEDLRQFRSYSDPARDPRHHTVTVVFIARGRGEPKAGDDAAALQVFSLHDLPQAIAFDHGRILDDYLQTLNQDTP